MNDSGRAQHPPPTSDDPDDPKPGSASDSSSSAISTSEVPWPSFVRLGQRILGHPAMIPVYCAVALGFHYTYTVPPKIPTAQEVAPKKKKKKAAAAKRARQRKTAKAAKAPRGRIQAKKAYKQHKSKDFEREPVDKAWAPDAKRSVSRVFAKARDTAFDGAPGGVELSVGTVVCKTARCRVEARSPHDYELEMLGKSIRVAKHERRKLWFDVTEEQLGAQEGKHAGVAYIVAPTSIDFEVDSIVFGE